MDSAISLRPGAAVAATGNRPAAASAAACHRFAGFFMSISVHTLRDGATLGGRRLPCQSNLGDNGVTVACGSSAAGARVLPMSPQYAVTHVSGMDQRQLACNFQIRRAGRRTRRLPGLPLTNIVHEQHAQSCTSGARFSASIFQRESRKARGRRAHSPDLPSPISVPAGRAFFQFRATATGRGDV